MNNRRNSRFRPSSTFVAVPVSRVLHVDFAVLSNAEEFLELDPEDIRKRVIAWGQEHLESESAECLLRYVRDPDLVGFEFIAAEDFELPEDEFLSGSLGPEELPNLRAAAGAWLVSAVDTLDYPRNGFAAARIAAFAFAASVGGWILDAASSEIVSVKPDSIPPEFDPYPDLLNEMKVITDQDEEGLAWVLVTGLEKFGLPELAVDNVLPRDLDNVLEFLGVLATFLSTRARELEPRDTQPQYLRLDTPLFITANTIREASDPELEWPASNPLEGLRIECTLEHEADDDSLGTLVVLPPLSNTKEPSAWWTEISKKMHQYQMEASKLGGDYQVEEDTDEIEAAPEPGAPLVRIANRNRTPLR